MCADGDMGQTLGFTLPLRNTLETSPHTAFLGCLTCTGLWEHSHLDPRRFCRALRLPRDPQTRAHPAPQGPALHPASAVQETIPRTCRDDGVALGRASCSTGPLGQGFGPTPKAWHSVLPPDPQVLWGKGGGKALLQERQ